MFVTKMQKQNEEINVSNAYNNNTQQFYTDCCSDILLLILYSTISSSIICCRSVKLGRFCGHLCQHGYNKRSYIDCGHMDGFDKLIFFLDNKRENKKMR